MTCVFRFSFVNIHSWPILDDIQCASALTSWRIWLRIRHMHSEPGHSKCCYKDRACLTRTRVATCMCTCFATGKKTHATSKPLMVLMSGPPRMLHQKYSHWLYHSTGIMKCCNCQPSKQSLAGPRLVIHRLQTWDTHQKMVKGVCILYCLQSSQLCLSRFIFSIRFSPVSSHLFIWVAQSRCRWSTTKWLMSSLDVWKQSHEICVYKFECIVSMLPFKTH